jgi:FtsP/CotA-like multicopper oxidase with cupredoxin domain
MNTSRFLPPTGRALLLLLLLSGAAVHHFGRAATRGTGAPPASDDKSLDGRRAPRPTRRYFIAAEKVKWSYAPLGKESNGVALPARWHAEQTYDKYHYVQYTDATFTTPVKQPSWIGILGPVIRGVVGERLLVTFFNRTDRVLSMHPHGLKYDKESEGAYYAPEPGKGSWVIPHDKFTYTWDADEDSGPAPGEPSSKVWLYHSHVAADADINFGLIGAIIITDRAHARPDATPDDVDREFVTLFMIFDENGGLGMDMDGDDDDPAMTQRREAFGKLSPMAQQEVLETGLKHTINGYFFNNLPGLEMYAGERVRWYLLALGSEQDLHTAHWHGQTVVEDGRRRTDDVELLPGSMKVADMRADNPGTWMFHCHVADHMMGGMYTLYVVHPKRTLHVNRETGKRNGNPRESRQRLPTLRPR